MNIDWNLIFTNSIGLVGVVLGVIGTSIGQIILNNKQYNRENEKEIKQKQLDRITVYNEVLKLDGENQMQKNIGGGYAELNLVAYRENIRPILYSKFHLLDESVVVKVREMDKIILEADFNEELDQDLGFKLMRLYYEIIIEIEKYSKKYRKNKSS